MWRTKQSYHLSVSKGREVKGTMSKLGDEALKDTGVVKYKRRGQ